jgi:hypothetical protein
MVCYVMIPCSSVSGYRRFVGTYCLCLQGRNEDSYFLGHDSLVCGDRRFGGTACSVTTECKIQAVSAIETLARTWIIAHHDLANHNPRSYIDQRNDCQPEECKL